MWELVLRDGKGLYRGVGFFRYLLKVQFIQESQNKIVE
jgi:hypothetical protein